MKNLSTLCMALCLAISCLAGDKMKLDLPITNDPRKSMFYFNGSGTAQIDHDGQKLTAEMDIDFEHPADGRYGSLTLYDSARNVVARYAMTKVTILNDAVSARVTLTGIDGTPGKADVNLDFHRDRDRNYSILFFLDPPPYFKSAQRLHFDSELRIAPRVKSAEELAQEAKIQKVAEDRQAREQAEQDHKRSRRDIYDTIGAVIGLSAIAFAVWMAPRANRRRRLPHLILFTVLALLSTFPPFILLPVMPAYFWWYRNLYNEDHGSYYLDRKFLRIFYWSCAILGIAFYGFFGWIALVYVLVWLIAGYVAHLLIYFKHLETARCHHCNYYGPNEIVSREYLYEQIHRTVTRRKEYSHTEEQSDRIIDWYKQKYNVRVEVDQHFRDLRRCEHCGEIFITCDYRTKTLSNRDY